MAIDKKLRLGGLENSPPKADQSPNRFKVANNVTFTNEGYLAPRSTMTGFTGNTSSSGFAMKRWTHFSSYIAPATNSPEVLKYGISGEGTNGYRQLFLGNTVVPSPNGNLGEEPSSTYENQFSDQSVEINKVKYILSSPTKSNQALLKFDGYEAYGAGIGDPYLAADVPTDPTTFSNRYVRVVGHSLDFQGNQITSDYVQYNAQIGSGGNLAFNSIAQKDYIDPFTGQWAKRYVAIGDQGVAYSNDGLNWDSNGVYFTGFLTKVTYSSVINKFIVVANGYSALSDDGVLWQIYNSTQLAGKTWTGVASGNGVIVAVNQNGVAASAAAVSTDGITWTLVAAPNTNSWQCVAFGGSPTQGFVALSSTGTGNRCMTSTNGLSWTARTTPSDQGWISLVWSFNLSLWTAVSATGTTATTQIMTNPNPFAGTAWTLRTSPITSIAWKDISEINGNLCAVSNTTSVAGRIITSNNATTWTTRNYTPSTAVLQMNCVLGTTIANEDCFISGLYNFSTFGLTDPKTLVYSKVSALATWTELDSPIITTISIKPTIGQYTGFMYYSGNTTKGDVPSDLVPLFYGQILSYDAVNNYYQTTLGPTGSVWGLNTCTIGTYVIIPINYTRIENNKIIDTYYAMALKYIGNDRFSGDIKLYSKSSGWTDMSGWDSDWLAQERWKGIFVGARRFFTVWASPSANGIYYYKGIIPGANSSFDSNPTTSLITAWNVNIRSTVLENTVTKASTLPFAISGNLNAWYDVTSVKSPFNYISSPVTVGPNTSVSPNIPAVTNFEPMVSLTTYQDLLVLATENTVYFSDTTFGGSVEMMNGLSSLVIGETQYGRITSVVGTKDYLYVSRERKVYMVAGSLPTANIRVQEIPDVPVGAYSNSSMIEIYGTVFMMASSGAWLLNASNSKKISGAIPLNFKSIFRSSTSLLPLVDQNSVGFNLSYYPTTAYESYTGGPLGSFPKYLVAVFDAFRSRVIITNADFENGGQSLVFHTENGEWTTFDFYDDVSTSVTAMAFVNGIMYVGNYRYSGTTAVTSTEVPVASTYDYQTRSPSKLVTTWMTQGEPSLEKQLLQFKFFGYLTSGARFSIKHYENWDYSTVVTNATYTSPSSNTMFHKQRLNSSKPMSAAIEFSMASGGATPNFWIEGMEVEFENIQRGMKR